MATTSDIAHRWANQLFGKRDGTLSSKSTYCNENSFYSYSTVIAQWLDKERKIMAVIDISLTKSTCRHIRDIERAIPYDTTVFRFHRASRTSYNGYANVDVLDYCGNLNPMVVTKEFVRLLSEVFLNVPKCNNLCPGNLHWWDELKRWTKYYPKASVNHYLKLKMPDKTWNDGRNYKEEKRNRKMLRALLNGATFEEVVDVVNGEGTWEAYLNRTKGVRTQSANRDKAEKIARYIGYYSVKSCPFLMRGILDMSPLERVTHKLSLITNPSKHEIKQRKTESANRLLKYLGIQGEYHINGWFSFSNEPKIVVDPFTGLEIYNSSHRCDWRLPVLRFTNGDMKEAMKNPRKFRDWFLSKARAIGKLHRGSKLTSITAITEYDKECLAAYQEAKRRRDARGDARLKREEAERKRIEAERREKELQRQRIVDMYHADGIDGYRRLWRERYDRTPHSENFSASDFFFGGNVLLRYNERSEKVETSKDIILTVSQAKKLWKAVVIWHNKPDKFQRINIPTERGTYTAHSYNNDILIAGCHSIAYEEMERMARQLNFIQ